MKIAIVAPVEESIPPKKYGGIEWIVYEIAHGMGKKGYIVDLYASGDSKKEESYNLIPITDSSLRPDPIYQADSKLLEVEKFQSILKTYTLIQKGNYDIVHNHAGWRFSLFSKLIGNKIITTLHKPVSIRFEAKVFKDNKESNYISISNNQRLDLPELNYVATIYNTINVNSFPVNNLNASKDSYMLFFARMDHDKGAIEAAKVALSTKKKLIVAAKVDKTEEEYFSKFKPFIDDNFVKFIGEVSFEDKIKYYENARCLLAPIQWEEPFGLFFLEAMASGTPIITMARGSIPEIIKDGKTGFIVNSSPEDIRGDWIIKKTGIEGLCEAIEKLYSLPDDQYLEMRKNCIKHVKENFSLNHMIDQYEEIYKQIYKTV